MVKGERDTMLPRLPRHLLQRPIHLPKHIVGTSRTTHLRFSKTFSTVLCVNNVCPSTFKAHLSARSCSCIFESSRPAYNRMFCKLKSTKPNQSEEPESDDLGDKSNQSSISKDKDDDVALMNQTTEHRPAKRKSAVGTGSSLVTQKSPEEEEKSRRRYEKEDPPEEERHKYHKTKSDRSINKALLRTDFFDNMKSKNKETFGLAIELFQEHDIHLRGHVEFIYSALKQMKKFGVHRDVETYKKIIDVFPKGKMIQTNMFQVEFMHYPKHQQCALDVLEQMEKYGVIPDSDVHQLLTNIFGSWSFPMRKAKRMLYWMPKFKHLSPWPLPEELPDSSLELAKLAVAQMTSADLTTKITVYDCTELEDAYDMTWIVSGQSADQQALIEKLPTDRPIYVEGAFRVWLRSVCMNYFILRADPKVPPPSKILDPDDVGNLHTVYEEEFLDTALEPIPTVHEQEDGIILGICCTGSSSRDSVVSWIRFLEKTNPRLGKDISVLFTLKSALGPTDDVEILSYRDLAELKKIGKHRDPFLSSADDLGLDPGMPDLRQVGIWTDSETKFPNWPHHFHEPDSVSAQNKLDNERILEELEEAERSKKFKDEIGNLSEKSRTDEVKKIE